MSYEKFITDFLNIKPSDLSKISTSTGSDGSVFIRIRLSRKAVLCPYCYENMKLQHLLHCFSIIKYTMNKGILQYNKHKKIDKNTNKNRNA